MQPNLIRIGTPGHLTELPQEGRKLVMRWLDGLVREERAASGKLRRDTIAQKRGFTISYELADQATVDILDAAWVLDTELTLEVTHLTTVSTYTVLMSPFEKERLLAVWGGMWQGLSVEFFQV